MNSPEKIADAMIAESLERIGMSGSGSDVEPSDIELIDCYIEQFGGTREQAHARLLRFGK